MVRFPEQAMDGTNFTAFFKVINDQAGGGLGWLLLIIVFIVVFSLNKQGNTIAKSIVPAALITLLASILLLTAGLVTHLEVIICLIIAIASMLWSYHESAGSGY